MATIPDGEDVIEFLNRLPAGGWVTAVGAVTDPMILHEAGPDATPESLEGLAFLVSLQGPTRGPFMALLAFGRTADKALIGGRLVSARSMHVDYTLVGQPAQVGQPGPEAAAPAAPAAPAGAAGQAATIRGSVPANDDESDEADELPEPGDRIDHFVFGLCDVMVVTGERVKIREIGGGKLREIHVGPFRITKPVLSGGKRVFKLVKR